MDFNLGYLVITRLLAASSFPLLVHNSPALQCITCSSTHDFLHRLHNVLGANEIALAPSAEAQEFPNRIARKAITCEDEQVASLGKEPLDRGRRC